MRWWLEKDVCYQATQTIICNSVSNWECQVGEIMVSDCQQCQVTEIMVSDCQSMPRPLCSCQYMSSWLGAK